MKILIRRMYVEIYKWQRSMWYNDDIPAFTSLLCLSTLHFINVFSIVLLMSVMLKVNVFNYPIANGTAVVVCLIFLFLTYIAVKPIKTTIEENEKRKGWYAFSYLVITFAILISTIVGVVIHNNNAGI